MWSDNDIDNAFQRLNPPEPEPAPFPLDAWLRLETELDKAVIERAVRRRLWKFFAAEVAIVLLIGLGWLLWPTGTTRPAVEPLKPTVAVGKKATNAANNSLGRRATAPQSATADAIIPVRAALRSTKSATVTPAPAAPAALESAAETPKQESASYSATTIVAANPAVKYSPSKAHSSPEAITRTSVATTTTPSRRQRNVAEGRHAYQGIVTPQYAQRVHGRRSTSSLPKHPSAENRLTEAAARQGRNQVSALAHHTDPHPAAGSIAVPTEAPAEAVVADAASASQLRREGQSPLRNQAAILPATPASEASQTGAPDSSAAASGTAIATLAPNSAQLLLAGAATLPTPLAPITAVPANLPTPVRQPRFYIGLVAAPDLTTVKFVDVERPKLNIGVVLEYRLTNRLRVSTGLLRANKEYFARREDYDWSAYPRAATRNFTWVDGACTVLDVPLNLRYDAVVRPQARLFGSVGLSSFFMQRERYSYDYKEYNTSYYWERSYVNANRHLFSVLNLSFGYEHQLGKHLSLQAEPYLKVPLAGVGAGKVRLTSGGIFFGVKYGF